MEIFAFSGLVNGIVALFFGALVFVKDPRHRTNQIFFMMTLAIAVWSFGYFQWLSSVSYDNALFWARILSAGSLFIPVFFFHWVLKVLNKTEGHLKIIWLSYVVAIIFSFFVFTDFLVSGLETKLFFEFWPIPGMLYSAYLLFIYIGLVSYSLILLISAYRNSRGNFKWQLFYIILGVILGFGGGITNFFLWYDISIPPSGNFFVALFPFLLGYATLRHGLFNIKVIATELLTFALWIFILVRTLLAESNAELITNGALLTLTILVGIFLIGSVRKEVETREEIEDLADALSKANVRLKELDELKSEFLSIASHQMRAPLTSIKGYASLILDGSYGRVQDSVRRAAERIVSSTETMINAVEDFLNVSRIEQGKIMYDFESTDLKKITFEVVEELKPNVHTKGLSISFSDDGKEEYRVRADVSKIKQIIGNLVDNAIKYTKEGSISVGLRHTGDRVVVSVSDTGVGLSEEDIARLFRKFTRAKGANKVNVHGTGLGLYVAKEMIKEHGGRIWVESEGKGRGATFYISLNAV